MRTAKIYLLILLYMFAPILCVLLSSAVASATGSRLDEGTTHPCIIFGCDLGWLLYALFVCGWLAFFTVPTGLLAIVITILVRGLRRRVHS